MLTSQLSSLLGHFNGWARQGVYLSPSLCQTIAGDLADALEQAHAMQNRPIGFGMLATGDLGPNVRRVDFIGASIARGRAAMPPKGAA